MKYLYVMRHAHAMSISSANVSDLSRPLTAEGEQDAKAIGDYLQKLGCMPQCVLTSPAVRTQMTTNALLKAFAETMPPVLTEVELYNASIETLFRVVRSMPEHYQRVYLVGHNPGVTQLVEYLTGMSISSMVPASVYLLSLSIPDWSALTKGSAELMLFIRPNFLQPHD